MSSPKKKENRFPVFTSSIKREIGKKCTKTRDARAKLLFLPIETYCFFGVLVDVAVVVAFRDLKRVPGGAT